MTTSSISIATLQLGSLGPVLWASRKPSIFQISEPLIAGGWNRERWRGEGGHALEACKYQAAARLRAECGLLPLIAERERGCKKDEVAYGDFPKQRYGLCRASFRLGYRRNIG